MSFNIVILLLYLRFFRNRRGLTSIRNDEIDRVQSECDFYKNEAEKYKLEAEYYKQKAYRMENELDLLRKDRMNCREKEGDSISDINHTIPEIKDKPKNEDRLNANDFFSRLPDLCIIEIFKRLPREDIFNMSMASTRFFPLTNEISLDGIKWEKGYLSFYKTAKGYSFRLSVSKKHPTYNYYAIEFDYGIIKNEDGDLIEKKEIGPFDDNYDNPSERYWTGRRSWHSWSVPDALLWNLSLLLKQRNIFNIAFFGFPIESEFYLKLAAILKGHSVNKFDEFHQVKNQPVNEEGRQSFARFIKNLKSVDLEESQNLINEEFLKEIKGGSLIHFSASSEEHPQRGYFGIYDRVSHYFRPSQSILPYLIGYDVLEVPTLILNRDWLVDLCMMAIETLDKTTKKLCTLQLAIDREITSDQISLQLRHNYEYELDNREHLIKRDDGIAARIIRTDYRLNGEIIRSVWIEVYGMGRQEEIRRRPGYINTRHNRYYVAPN